jgi:GR25 family glycosyltransferase involved in LPS biosynthesis
MKAYDYYHQFIFYAWKKKRKIKLVHLLSLPEEEREKKSIENLSSLSEFGIDYVQHINKPYHELPPKDSCRYPDEVGMKPGHYIRTPGAYGCYLAHKDAILKGFDDSVDFLLVCECDCVMLVEPEEFYSELSKICNALESEKDIVYVNLSSDPKENVEGTDYRSCYSDPNGWGRDVKETIGDSLSIVDKTLLADCILYQKSSVDTVKEKFLNEKWDVTDLWQQEVFINHRKAYSKTPMTIQFKGESLIDYKNNIATRIVSNEKNIN